MKLLKKIVEVFAKHELSELILPGNHHDVYSFLQENPDFKEDFISAKNDGYLLTKYRRFIPKGWYGFSIGSPIIPVWIDILEEVLDICIENDPEFEIQQIKLKFGGIRFYCESAVIEDIYDIESLIETNLFDRALIY